MHFTRTSRKKSAADWEKVSKGTNRGKFPHTRLKPVCVCWTSSHMSPCLPSYCSIVCSQPSPASKNDFRQFSLCKPNSFSATLPRSYKRVQRWISWIGSKLASNDVSQFPSVKRHTLFSREKNIKILSARNEVQFWSFRAV